MSGLALAHGIGAPRADPESGAGHTAHSQILLIDGQAVAERLLPDGTWSEPLTPERILMEHLLTIAHAVGFAPVGVTLTRGSEVLDFDPVSARLKVRFPVFSQRHAPNRTFVAAKWMKRLIPATVVQI